MLVDVGSLIGSTPNHLTFGDWIPLGLLVMDPGDPETPTDLRQVEFLPIFCFMLGSSAEMSAISWAKRQRLQNRVSSSLPCLIRVHPEPKNGQKKSRRLRDLFHELPKRRQYLNIFEFFKSSCQNTCQHLHYFS